MAARLKSKLSSSQHLGPLALILLLVLTINAPSLLGLVDTNPLQTRSGLSRVLEGGLVSGIHTIEPNDGLTSQALGAQAADQWLRGDLPLWNPYEATGVPLLGEAQSASTFLPFIFTLKFANGHLFLHIWLELIAGFAMYALMIKLGRSRAAGLAAAAIFAANGAFVWNGSSAFNPIAFLPMTLLGIEILRTERGRKAAFGFVITALSLFWSINAGFPETAYIHGLLITVWVLLRAFQAGKKSGISIILRSGSAAAIGLALSAPFIVSFATYLPEADVGIHSSGTGGALTLYGIPAQLLPYVYGPINGPSDVIQPLVFWGSVGGYLSLAGVMVAAVSLLARRERGLKIALLAWILICAARIYGMPVISPLVDLIPGLGESAFYRYCTPSMAFAIAVMAGLGLDDLRNRDRFAPATSSLRKPVAAILAVTALALAGAIFAVIQLDKYDVDPPRYGWIIGSVVGALLIASLLVFTVTRVKNRTLAIRLATAVIAAEAAIMFLIPSLSAPQMTPVNYTPPNYLIKNLGNQRFFSLGPIQPNYGSYFNIRSINHNDIPIAKKWVEYVDKNLQSNGIFVTFDGEFRNDPEGPSPNQEFVANPDKFRDVGVTHIITSQNELTPEEIEKVGLTRVFSNEAADIFRMEGARKPFEVRAQDKCSITIKSENKALFDCAAPAVATRSVTNLRGWNVKINSKSAEITDKESLFQNFKLPAGKSEVVFKYWPAGLTASLFAAFFGFLALILAPFVPQLFKGPSKPEPLASAPDSAL